MTTVTRTLLLAFGLVVALVAFPAASRADEVLFAGDARGMVAVAQGPVKVTCDAACTVTLTAGDVVHIYTSTPSEYGGLSGACSSTGSECTFTMSPTTTALTATFERAPGELWTAILPSRLIAIDHDGSGNVIVASPTEIAKIDGTGAILWTRTLPVSGLATGPNDTIYVISGTDLKKLDATSADL